MNLEGKRVISGTWGEAWLDGEKVAECYGAQAKFSANKETVNLCGSMFEDKKIMSLGGTGSLRMHKVNSRMALLVGEKLKNGEDPRFTLILKLADPDAYGAERVALYNVSFDDVTLADWEARALGKVECPFTFTDFELLDAISA